MFTVISNIFGWPLGPKNKPTVWTDRLLMYEARADLLTRTPFGLPVLPDLIGAEQTKNKESCLFNKKKLKNQKLLAFKIN
jgi:hypothetical protein